MGAKDDLITALAELETAARTLATAHANYVTAASAVINSADTENRKVTLNAHLGPGRVNEALAMRMRALGLGGLLERSRVPGKLGESWSTVIQAKVQALA